MSSSSSSSSSSSGTGKNAPIHEVEDTLQELDGILASISSPVPSKIQPVGSSSSSSVINTSATTDGSGIKSNISNSRDISSSSSGLSLSSSNSSVNSYDLFAGQFTSEQEKEMLLDAALAELNRIEQHQQQFQSQSQSQSSPTDLYQQHPQQQEGQQDDLYDPSLDALLVEMQNDMDQDLKKISVNSPSSPSSPSNKSFDDGFDSNKRVTREESNNKLAEGWYVKDWPDETNNYNKTNNNNNASIQKQRQVGDVGVKKTNFATQRSSSSSSGLAVGMSNRSSTSGNNNNNSIATLPLQQQIEQWTQLSKEVAGEAKNILGALETFDDLDTLHRAFAVAPFSSPSASTVPLIRQKEVELEKMVKKMGEILQKTFQFMATEDIHAVSECMKAVVFKTTQFIQTAQEKRKLSTASTEELYQIIKSSLRAKLVELLRKVQTAVENKVKRMQSALGDAEQNQRFRECIQEATQLGIQAGRTLQEVDLNLPELKKTITTMVRGVIKAADLMNEGKQKDMLLSTSKVVLLSMQELATKPSDIRTRINLVQDITDWLRVLSEAAGSQNINL